LKNDTNKVFLRRVPWAEESSDVEAFDDLAYHRVLGPLLADAQ